MQQKKQLISFKPKCDICRQNPTDKYLCCGGCKSNICIKCMDSSSRYVKCYFCSKCTSCDIPTTLLVYKQCIPCRYKPTDCTLCDRTVSAKSILNGICRPCRQISNSEECQFQNGISEFFSTFDQLSENGIIVCAMCNENEKTHRCNCNAAMCNTCNGCNFCI